MNNLLKYRRMALKMVEIVDLGDDEGYATKIAGFAGLLAAGSNKKTAMAELASALDHWIGIALRRGLGLPALVAPKMHTSVRKG